MTVRELITDALEEIGAIAPGESLSDADAQAGLTRLNSMLDKWQAERLTIYNLVSHAFSFVANQQTYTIGVTGADFTVTFRPEFIDRAAVLTGTAPDQVEIPLEILSDDRWADVRVKSVTSTFPTKVYYNPTVPLGQLWVWPIPTVTTNQIVLYLPTPLLRVAGLSVDLVLPPAYEEAIRYNLALRLCPPFGRPATPDLVQFATDALGAIKRTNIKLDELKCDPALTNAGQVWNFFTGGM